MLQRLGPTSTLSQEVHRFLTDLRHGFHGDIAIDESSLVVASTDNSIWQMTPQAVLSPLDRLSVEFLLRTLSKEEHRKVSITPRGGGTSTAGQSLTNSIVLDCKKHMGQVLQFDQETKHVRVQCGAVLQHINDELGQYGCRIGPTVATATRATIGGMIGNDSAGKGSLVYGKTSDCVVELETVLRDGTVWNSRSLQCDELATLENESGLIGDIHRAIRKACESAQPFFKDNWPVLPRFLTGYNLPMAWNGQTFDLNRILCGSEGTLGITTSAVLQCVAIPTRQQLLLLCFDTFDSALRCGAALWKYAPTAIETVDHLVLQAARNDASWSEVSSLFTEVADDIGAVLFVEFSDQGIDDIKKARQEACSSYQPIFVDILDEPKAIESAWEFRSRSVGLLSSLSGTNTPIPFVEDCAVPPEKLADFILEFQKLLDRHDLSSGMFGHVDAGVIHVRPALDMQAQSDRDKVQLVTDQVVDLVQSFGGVLWGEHGKGIRSTFSPRVFGEEIWAQMCTVKAAFDPHNQFNPNKVAPPHNTTRLTIDARTRGEIDEQSQPIPEFINTTRCDGNSECQNQSMQSSMCPTYRVTNDPKHSPRGRSDILRHWLSRIGNEPIDYSGSFIRRLINSGGGKDFSHEVYEVLDGCLSCKACATDCPMHIDIPSMRSHFYNAYYSRYLRPIRDIAWFNMERFLPFLSTRIGRCLSSRFLSGLIGISDPPNIASTPLPKELRRAGLTTSTEKEILDSRPAVVLLQDSFTSYFRPSVFLAMVTILEHLEIPFAILPLRPCGKVLHVRGGLTAFTKIAKQNVDRLACIRDAHLPIVGIDPAATLLWRDEYPEVLGLTDPPVHVSLPQEWLIDQDLSSIRLDTDWRLFPHCIEKAVSKSSSKQWSNIFDSTGSSLQIVETSCCGMGGIFGHQREYRDQSIGIWNLHWKQHDPSAKTSITTGFSCHSQALRIENQRLLHPLEVIASSILSQRQQMDANQEHS